MKPVIVPDRFAPGMVLQLERFRDALEGGMRRRGWKIGINVPEVLRQLDLPHAGVGWIDGSRVFATGAKVARPPDARLHVEPEVAIVLSEVVDPGSSAETARSCIESVCPALEIVDYARKSAGLDDVVAHCMFHHATILGPSASLESARALGRDLPVLHVGPRSSEPPRDDLVPPDLGELVAFVARYLSAFGESLDPGDIVLSGSYTAKAVAIETGEKAIARFGALGSVSVTITA